MDAGQATDRRPARRLSPAVFLLVAALALVPWIGWLAASLPCSYRSQHWGIAWAGFDAGLALVLGLTGFAALRRAPWLEHAAVAAAALLVADAWFDVVTSRGAGAVAMAVAEAVVIELPIAAFCLRLARSATPPQQPGAPRGERRPAQLPVASRARLRLSPPSASAPSVLSPSRAGSSLTPKERFTMNRCDVCIRDLDPLISFAAARWELLTFPEVRDLLRGFGRDRFVVLYDGDAPDIDGWCGRLTEAGFPASRIHKLNDTGATAS
jgi:hypothetical protein